MSVNSPAVTDLFALKIIATIPVLSKQRGDQKKEIFSFLFV